MTNEEAYERAIGKLDAAKILFIEAQDFEGASEARKLKEYAKDRLKEEIRTERKDWVRHQEMGEASKESGSGRNQPTGADMKELTRDQVAEAVKQIRTNEGFSGPADDGGDAATVNAFMHAQSDIKAQYAGVGSLPVTAIIAILKQVLPIFIKDTNVLNTINTVLDLIAKFF